MSTTTKRSSRKAPARAHTTTGLEQVDPAQLSNAIMTIQHAIPLFARNKQIANRMPESLKTFARDFRTWGSFANKHVVTLNRPYEAGVPVRGTAKGKTSGAAASRGGSQT